MLLTPRPLLARDFEPFGSVLEVTEAEPLSINGGNTERFDALAAVELSGAHDRAVISIFRGQPRQLPLRVELMERHPLGSQCFFPLSGQPYLVLVAPGSEQPDLSALQLFLAQPDQGVQYATNTWHHPLLGLNQVCDFLVVDRQGEGTNCEEFFVPQGQSIMIQMD